MMSRVTNYIILTIIISLFIIVVSPIFTSISKTAFGTTSFKSYNNTDFGFSVKYPINWTVVEDNLPKDTVVNFKTDGATVQINVFDYPKGSTFTSMSHDYLNITKHSDTTKFIKAENTTLANHKAIKVTYYLSSQPSILNSMLGNSASTTKGFDVRIIDPQTLRVYSFQYGAFPSRFNHFLPTIEQMIKSFEVVTNNGG